VWVGETEVFYQNEATILPGTGVRTNRDPDFSFVGARVVDLEEQIPKPTAGS
jgi:hypothetical protein